MMKLPQPTWVETFLEGVTDKSTGLSIFKELAWFTYKFSGVMCSASTCEHCWSIEGWIHSKRRNRLHQMLVEKLVRAPTNLVLRESLDDSLHHLLRLLRVKTQTWSKRTSIKHLFLVMITSLRCWNTTNNKISKECVQRERKRQRVTHFFF
jgi:hypothetical protein